MPCRQARHAAEESVCQCEQRAGAPPLPTALRHPEIRNQPPGAGLRDGGRLRRDDFKIVRRKTVEEEVARDQIELLAAGAPGSEVRLFKPDLLRAQTVHLQSSPGLENHPFTGFHARHGCARIVAQQLDEEATGPLADGEDRATAFRRVEEFRTAALEVLSDGESLKPAIVRRDPIEVHGLAIDRLGRRQARFHQTHATTPPTL